MNIYKEINLKMMLYSNDNTIKTVEPIGKKKMSNRDSFLGNNKIGLLIFGILIFSSSISLLFENMLFTFYTSHQDILNHMNNLQVNLEKSKSYGLESFATVQFITGLLVVGINFFICLYIIAKSYHCSFSASKQCQIFYINPTIQEYGISQEKLFPLLLLSTFGLFVIDTSSTGYLFELDSTMDSIKDSFFLGTKIGIFLLNSALTAFALVIAYTIIEILAHVKKYLSDMKITIIAISLYVVLIIIGGYFIMKAIFRFWEVDLYILNGDITSNDLYNILIYTILGIVFLKLSSFIKNKYNIRVRDA